MPDQAPVKRPLGFNLTASTINSFNSCPWAWAQKKILKRKPPSDPSPYLVLGNSFHHIIEDFYAREYNLGSWNTNWIFKNWERVFKIEAKKEGAENHPQLHFIRSGGLTMIKNWVAMAKENDWLQDPFIINGKPAVELKFSVPYDNDRFEAKMTGAIDLVMHSKRLNRLSVIDWKSGKHHDNYRMQGLIYSATFYKQYGFTEDEVLFVHPAKKQNIIKRFQFEDTDYKEITSSVDVIFDAVEKNEFPKVKHDGCKYCPWTECENNCNKNLKLEEAKESPAKFDLLAADSQLEEPDQL